MRKVNILIRIFLISFLFGFSCVLIVAHYYKEPIIKLVPYIDPNYVQTPTEAQQRLKRQGYYKGKIDGIWGPNTDKAYCDWCAVKEFKRWENQECEK